PGARAARAGSARSRPAPGGSWPAVGPAQRRRLALGSLLAGFGGLGQGLAGLVQGRQLARQAVAGPAQGRAGGIELGLAGVLAVVLDPQPVLEQVALGLA